MIWAGFLTAAVLVSGQFLVTDVDDLAREIADQEFKVIGVIPRVVTTSKDGSEVVGGSLGPQADLIPQQVSSELAAAVAKGPLKGKFRVVSQRVMKTSFAKMSPESLGDTAAIKTAGKSSSADAFLLITATNSADSISKKFSLIPADGREAPPVSTEISDKKTLLDSAFTGESWVARLVDREGTVSPVGLQPPGPDAGETPIQPNGAPSENDLPATAITPGQQHPLTRDDLQFGFDVQVAKQDVRTAKIGEDIYVAVEEGDTYTLRVWNKSPKPVYMGMYIDGINTIGKELEGPAFTPANRMWYLAPAPGKRRIGGFLTIGVAGATEQTEEKFLVSSREESIAAGKNFTDRLGIITAVVFDFVPLDGAKAIPSIGTKAGEKSQIQVREWGTGKRGAVLAAISVRYCTNAELDALIAAHGGSAGGETNGASTGGNSNNNQANSGRTDGTSGGTNESKVNPDRTDNAASSESLANNAFNRPGRRRRKANGDGQDEEKSATDNSTPSVPDESVPFPRADTPAGTTSGGNG